jgi:hypothetical protein
LLDIDDYDLPTDEPWAVALAKKNAGLAIVSDSSQSSKSLGTSDKKRVWKPSELSKAEFSKPTRLDGNDTKKKRKPRNKKKSQNTKESDNGFKGVNGIRSGEDISIQSKGDSVDSMLNSEKVVRPL